MSKILNIINKHSNKFTSSDLNVKLDNLDVLIMDLKECGVGFDDLGEESFNSIIDVFSSNMVMGNESKNRLKYYLMHQIMVGLDYKGHGNINPKDLKNVIESTKEEEAQFIYSENNELEDNNE